MARRGRLAIVAATSDNGGGWLSQWFQNLMSGQKAKDGGNSTASKQAVEQTPPSPAASRGVSATAMQHTQQSDDRYSEAGGSLLNPVNPVSALRIMPVHW